MPTIIGSLLFSLSKKISVERHRQKVNTGAAEGGSVGLEVWILSASVTVGTADKLCMVSSGEGGKQDQGEALVKTSFERYQRIGP